MLIFWVADLIRRQILVSIVAFSDTFWLQMFVLFNQSVAMIAVAGYTEVRTSQYHKSMDMFNEIRLVLIMYHMLLFTGFLPDLDMRRKVGYSCSGIIIVGILVNMSQLIISPTKTMIRNCKIRYALQRRSEMIKVQKPLFDGNNFILRIRKKAKN